MNIQEFDEKFKSIKGSERISIKCDHENHDGDLSILGKQPARRNILKNNGERFICRGCFMKYNNPMNHVGESRQTDEIIIVTCPDPNHLGDPNREMKKSCFYGEMKEPYLQVCKSCGQRGKIISEQQKQAISQTLKGRKLSPEHKAKILEFRVNNPDWAEKANKNLRPELGRGWNKGLNTPDEVKEKISKSNTGKVRTEEQRNRISVGRRKMLKETGGFTKEHRENLRQATLRQYEAGFDPKNHHISGWHQSPKAGRVFFRSSYEKRAFLKLDEDINVKTYFVENIKIDYECENIQQTYLVDLEIEYTDGKRKLIEVKPYILLKLVSNQAKISAGVAFANNNGYKFEVWTEIELFGEVYNKRNVQNFIIKLKEELGCKLEDEEFRIKHTEKVKKYYRNNIANNTVKIECNFCNEVHEILKLTHDRNIKNNGRFICIKENGHLIGSKSLNKKENPYAKDGKKQCVLCKNILEYNGFGSDKSRADGHSSRCKQCRAKVALEKYYQTKS